MGRPRSRGHSFAQVERKMEQARTHFRGGLTMPTFTDEQKRAVRAVRMGAKVDEATGRDRWKLMWARTRLQLGDV